MPAQGSGQKEKSVHVLEELFHNRHHHYRSNHVTGCSCYTYNTLVGLMENSFSFLFLFVLLRPKYHRRPMAVEFVIYYSPVINATYAGRRLSLREKPIRSRWNREDEKKENWMGG